MKKGLLFGLLAAAVAFGAGAYFGRSTKQDVVISSSTSGASYGGGFKAEGDNAQASKTAATSDVLRSVAGPAPTNVVMVKDGESIQAAVKAAPAGTIIRVMPGTYHETVYIDKDDIRIIGVIEEGRRAVLDGQKKLNDAILYSGNNFVVENLEIRGYKGNGVMGQAGNNFEIRNNIITDSGVYGIFPQLGQNGIVEYNIVSGIADAAIYIGMSDNIHVAHNEVFDSVAGIEVENCRHVIVEHNYVHNNTGGLLAFVTPGLPIKTTVDVIFRNNFVVGNNHVNFGAPGSTVSGIPAGTGMLVMAADDVVIEGNIVSDHKTAGIIITDHAHAQNITADPESDPNSDRVKILDNVMLKNGYDMIPEVRAVLLSEAKGGGAIDIVRVGPSPGSCIINRHQYVTAGLGDFADCDFTNTAGISTYLLPSVPPRKIDPADRGKVAYLGICSGCHIYNGRMIGPPVQVIQALYLDNPQGLADYIAKPVKKRSDYPEMPPQDYLDPQTRIELAKNMHDLNN
ncbi:MAG: right-handed parallel beta-helix repeat-containing protein [Proteobacteria bacterium]|nr:right-handed parallel beta-helix repeat-containing protein [Pseudomonadota bacterium]